MVESLKRKKTNCTCYTSCMPRIAVIGSLFLPTTRDAKGGTEVWTALFLEQLVQKNYTVDLFACEGSIQIPDKITLHSFGKPINTLMHTYSYYTQFVKNQLLYPPKEYMLEHAISISVRMQQLIIQNQEDYDFVIDNTGFAAVVSNWDFFKKPVFVISHFGEIAPYISLFQLIPLPQNIYFVFPTQVQYSNASWIPPQQKSVISHGIDLGTFTYSPSSNNSLYWIGRVTPEKGLEDAIGVANKLEKPLIIFGYKWSHDYFENTIKPLLTSQIYYREDNFAAKHQNTSKALLFPVQWEEPFGISIIEALACGTPVITYARGSLPEIIQDGVTGFLVNPSPDDRRGKFQTKRSGIPGLIEATKLLYSLSDKDYEHMRFACRKAVEEKYSLSQMTNSYDNLFQQTIPS